MAKDPAKNELRAVDPAEVVGPPEVDYLPQGLGSASKESTVPNSASWIDSGSAASPRDAPQVRVYSDLRVEAVPVDDEISVGYAQQVTLAIQQCETAALRSYFEKSRHEIVFSFYDDVYPEILLGGKGMVDPVHIALTELAHGNLRLAFDRACREGRWTFCFDGTFDLTFDSCQPCLAMLEKFREQYKEAQQTRDEIDAQRDEWLHSQAEPLLDAMAEQLLDTSLPPGFRDELAELREILRKDAYGFSDLIETQDLEAILNIGDRRARDLSKKGELGVAFSRIYAHSKREAEHFAKKERRPGPPKKT